MNGKKELPKAAEKAFIEDFKRAHIPICSECGTGLKLVIRKNWPFGRKSTPRITRMWACRCRNMQRWAE